MKREKLKSVSIDDVDVLTRAQMRRIFGGDGGDEESEDSDNPSCNSQECMEKSTPGISCMCNPQYTKCGCAYVD